MMLGHWYLVTPKLSITPLKRYSAAYILLTVFTALKLVLAYHLFVGWSWPPSTAAGLRLMGEDLMFALFRVTWGVMAPLAASYFIWETVKIKSTQSATGILYASMVCTIIGEGMGATARKATPPLFETLAVLGRDVVRRRLRLCGEFMKRIK